MTRDSFLIQFILTFHNPATTSIEKTIEEAAYAADAIFGRLV